MRPEIRSDDISGICKFLISKAADRTLAISPLLWQPSDGTTSKVWYFMVGSGDKRKQFHCDQINVNDEADRMAILLHLMQHRPLVLHTFDDELNFAKWCEKLWPGERVTRIRKAVEQELADGTKPSPADRRQLADNNS
jgi:hypothetical protein